MAKNPKMVICRNCNTAIYKKAKICPNCGAKNKKPFYQKGGFIILVIIVVFGLISSIGSGNNSKKANRNDTSFESTEHKSLTESTATSQSDKTETKNNEDSVSEKPSEAAGNTELQNNGSALTSSDTKVADPAESTAPQVNDTAPENSQSSAAENTSAPADGLRPEFKAAMDSYEAFYDEYCAFMKKYSQNPTDLSLLTEYGKMLSRLEDMNNKFEAWESEDLSTAETKYYIEVNGRITQKLLDAAA